MTKIWLCEQVHYDGVDKVEIAFVKKEKAMMWLEQKRNEELTELLDKVVISEIKEYEPNCFEFEVGDVFFNFDYARGYRIFEVELQ